MSNIIETLPTLENTTVATDRAETPDVVAITPAAANVASAIPNPARAAGTDEYGEPLTLRNVNAFVREFETVNAHIYAAGYTLVHGAIRTAAGGSEYRPGPTFVSAASLRARRLFIRKNNTRKPTYVEISPENVDFDRGIVRVADAKPLAGKSAAAAPTVARIDL